LTGRRRRSSTVLAPDRMASANRGRRDSSKVLTPVIVVLVAVVLVTVVGLPGRER
jgi:hypothetical protein